METLQPSRAVLRARAHWRHRGTERPDFAEVPGPGQESVWDYPRPPRLAPDARRVEVRLGDRRLASTGSAIRVLETAGAPTWYLPPEDVELGELVENGRRSHCEWKGEAIELDLVGGPASVAWRYPRTYPAFARIAGWISFYPARLECYVEDERVRPQPGGFYGGWVTDEIVGPIKGEPGSEGW